MQTRLFAQKAAVRDLFVFFSHRECIEHALAIRKKLYGPKHPSVASALGNLGIMWEEVGYMSKAIHLHQEALAILEENFSFNHIEVRIKFSMLQKY